MPERTAAGRYREPSLLSLAEREDRIPAMREEATKALNALTVPAIWTPEVALRIFAKSRRHYPRADRPPICEMSGRTRYRLAGIRLAKPRHLEDAPMLYEVRTYTLRPGTTAEFEERFAKRLPLREKHSKLGAFWHTEFGPLNQVIHVYPYDDLGHRTRVRAAMAQDTAMQQLPGGGDLIAAMESEIMNPAPFMHALGSRDYGTGNVYEMRTYTYAPGDIPKVLEGWAKAIDAREKFSPLAACWTSELGGLNKFVHTWVYKDLGERAKVREESRRPGGAWPAQTGVRPIRQENKLLMPAAFSPVR